jgi:hypothetical protein
MGMAFFIVFNHGDLFDGGNCEKVFFPRTATRGIYPRFGENPAINILLETVLIYATFYPRRKAPAHSPGTHPDPPAFTVCLPASSVLFDKPEPGHH